MTERDGRVVVAAMDKFRGTATSRELSDLIERVATGEGRVVDVQPMSDGGEGFIDAFSGDVVTVEVTGPLGSSVTARIKLVETTSATTSSGTTAVVEVSDVVGRDLLPDPLEDEAVRASSEGVGQLILAAAQLGVRDVMVGCGGTATSDGGLGCYRVLRDAGGLPLPVSAATDVTARFLGALRYATQKGVRPDDLSFVDQRLNQARSLYRDERGIDVELLERSGAAGGIPGALAAFGASLTSGFAAVADAVDLATRIERADIVFTGEGRFDEGSLEGKVTVGVAEVVAPTARLVVVCGSVDGAAAREFQRRFANAVLISLEERYGADLARREVFACVERAVREELQG
jgi:glycerate kinase